MVYGRLVADKIIRDIKDISEPNIESVIYAVDNVEVRITQILGRKGQENLFKIKDAMTETMFHKFGIFRDGQRMDEGLTEIKKLQEKLSQASPHYKDWAVNQTLIQFLELEGMLKIAEVVAKGAFERKESRGSHTRTDHPERDDAQFLKHTLVVLRDGDIHVTYKPVILGMFKPKGRVY